MQICYHNLTCLSRIIGCQSVLNEIAGRVSRDLASTIGANYPESTVSSKSRNAKLTSSARQNSSTTRARESQSDEIIAVLRIDNKRVGQTDARPISRQAWDQRFSIDLDRVRLFSTYYFAYSFFSVKRIRN